MARRHQPDELADVPVMERARRRGVGRQHRLRGLRARRRGREGDLDRGPDRGRARRGGRDRLPRVAAAARAPRAVRCPAVTRLLIGKQSGLGRELGQEGLEAFQETKHVHVETKIAPKEWWYPYGGGGPREGAGA